MLTWPRLVVLDGKRTGEDDLRATKTKMPNGRPEAKQSVTLYATGEDFCGVFQQDMNRLYRLSWLLTGNHQTAENCFVQSLEDSVASTSIFKGWARSWVRRAVIQNAIKLIARTPSNQELVSISTRRVGLASMPVQVTTILTLPTFERFVFVLSALERYTDQECLLLLGCARCEVREARVRVLQSIASLDLERGQLATCRLTEDQTNEPSTCVAVFGSASKT